MTADSAASGAIRTHDASEEASVDANEENHSASSPDVSSDGARIGDASGGEVSGGDASAEGAGPTDRCAPDAGGSYSASLQFAGIGHVCEDFLGNVVVTNTAAAPIGPISTVTLYVPANGASWPVPYTYPGAIPPGGQVTITVGNGTRTPCPALSCLGSVDVEVEIAGAGIPPGARACGLAMVNGC